MLPRIVFFLMYYVMDEPPKEWNRHQESILKRWSEIGSSYRYLHDCAFAQYDKKKDYLCSFSYWVF